MKKNYKFLFILIFLAVVFGMATGVNKAKALTCAAYSASSGTAYGPGTALKNNLYTGDTLTLLDSDLSSDSAYLSSPLNGEIQYSPDGGTNWYYYNGSYQSYITPALVTGVTTYEIRIAYSTVSGSMLGPVNCPSVPVYPRYQLINAQDSSGNNLPNPLAFNLTQGSQQNGSFQVNNSIQLLADIVTATVNKDGNANNLINDGTLSNSQMTYIALITGTESTTPFQSSTGGPSWATLPNPFSMSISGYNNLTTLNYNIVSGDKAVGTYNDNITLTPSGSPADPNDSSQVFSSTVIPVQLTVVAPPPTVTFSPNTTINLGDSVTLSWTSANATAVSIVDNNGNTVGSNLPVNGSYSVSPKQTTTYTITATGASGTTPATAQAKVIVKSNYTVSCSAEPTSIYSGGSAIFSANTSGDIINKPLTYSWSNNGCSGNSCVVNNIASDISNYSVKVSDPYGYSASTTCPTVTVIKNQEPPVPVVSISGGPVFYVSQSKQPSITINVNNAAPNQLITFIPKQIQQNGQMQMGWIGSSGPNILPINHTNNEIIGFVTEAVNIMENHISNVNIRSLITDSNGKYNNSLAATCDDIGVYRLGVNVAGATSSDAVFAVAPDPNAKGSDDCLINPLSY